MKEEKKEGIFFYNHSKVKTHHGVKSTTFDGIEKEINNAKTFVSNFFSLVYIFNNDACVLLDNKKIEIKKNSMFIVDKYSTSILYSKTGNAFSFMTIDFKPELFGCSDKNVTRINKILPYIVNNLVVKSAIPENYIYEDTDGTIKNLFERTQQESQHKRFMYVDIIKNNIYEIIINVLRSVNTRDSEWHNDIDLIQNIVDFCMFNRHKKITIKDISEIFHYNEEYITRLFKEYFNISLTEYIKQEKINHALSLLTRTNKNIKEIAAEVGFDSVDYFSKVFKSYMGLAPLQYRNQLKKTNTWYSNT